ncbi:scarecrow-like protein 9 [Iris pallida]|uniref:Scarecrow-like protein 9 n=1 Tax=Iris pallida TaxID=29817 RepID=A0AAX6GVE4_IRIPA|nr:scarecrow-like protein 9 [Iris pallida]
MVLDPVMMDGLRFDGCFSSSSSDQNNRFARGGFRIEDPPPPQIFLNFADDEGTRRPGPLRAADPCSPEDSDVFSDAVLNYISRMLMEEDVDEKVNVLYQESPAIRAAEKPFYDILGEKYPHDTDPSSATDSADDSCNGAGSSSSNSGIYWSRSSVSSSNSAGSVVGAVESRQAWHFMKGMEEAQKLLPTEDKLVIDLEASRFPFPRGTKEEVNLVEVKAEREEREHSVNGSSRARRKNPGTEELEAAHGRSNKHSAVSAPSEEMTRSDIFDKVLLCNGDGHKCATASALLEAMQSGANRSMSVGGKTGGGKKQIKGKEVVDLRTLLVHCAQAVAADDRRTAYDLLKQIRLSSSPFGDGSQRLAHCFADGLEARLAGTGSQVYQSLFAKRTTATDILKAYQLFLAACPFKRVSHFYSNRTILNATEKATRVHIIDFGIYYGFQWPCLIQRLSARLEGPPRLRITGIDVPQPGFRPTERIEETGKRLADYARSFNVPFVYNAIASKWENITVEDLEIDKDEVLIVNCLYRFKNLVDETVVFDSPRNRVLNTIRKANPDVFIHGIVNGSYSAPFFVTRFREALFHYSALFDMLETTVPREDAQRLLIERDLFGQEALNVISCEGSARVERPETYKQWQVRNLRAGFRQLPLNQEIMKNARNKVKRCYHKDFVMDEDSQWLLQGWKGRTIYALSTWKPNRNY